MRCLLALSLAAGCYAPPEPACGFFCGAQGACPENYTCADGRCRRNDAPASLDCGNLPDAGGIPPDADTERPYVIATEPVDMAVDVSRDVSIFIAFNEDLAPVTEQMILVYSDAGAVTGTLTMVGRHVTFAPVAPLPGNLVVTVVATTDIRDLAGNHLGSNPLMHFAFTFTTVP